MLKEGGRRSQDWLLAATYMSSSGRDQFSGSARSVETAVLPTSSTGGDQSDAAIVTRRRVSACTPFFRHECWIVMARMEEAIAAVDISQRHVKWRELCAGLKYDPSVDESRECASAEPCEVLSRRKEEDDSFWTHGRLPLLRQISRVHLRLRRCIAGPEGGHTRLLNPMRRPYACTATTSHVT